jgi:hypothetical protein
MTQLLSTAGNPTDTPVAVRFRYHGASRIVDNIDFDGENIIVGFEMRRSGKFSYKIKKFKLNEIDGLTYINPPHRSGPVIGRPTR